MNGVTNAKSATAMPDPANTIVIRESSTYSDVPSVAPWNYIGMWDGDGWASVESVGFDSNHEGGGVFSFGDGHVKYQKKTAVKLSQFGFTGTCLLNGAATNSAETLSEDPTGASDKIHCPTTTF
jgi:hypothetical protein